MYIISFDLVTTSLMKYYTGHYTSAYWRIKRLMKQYGFEWTQGSMYVSVDPNNSLARVNRVMDALREINWFRESVRDIRVYKVEDWSDFTPIVKGEM